MTQHKPRYLALFILPKVEKEHAAILEAVAHHSAGDFKALFTIPTAKGGAVIAYVFTSMEVPWKMGFGTEFNGDNRLVVQLDDNFYEAGMNVAGAWLKARQVER